MILSLSLKVKLFDVSTQLGLQQSEIEIYRPSVAVAWAFSDVFKVYTAKRYPGRVNPTVLSMCLAMQGLKISTHGTEKAARRERRREENGSEKRMSITRKHLRHKNKKRCYREKL
jgi:hypothetical protein